MGVYSEICEPNIPDGNLDFRKFTNSLWYKILLI